MSSDTASSYVEPALSVNQQLLFTDLTNSLRQLETRAQIADAVCVALDVLLQRQGRDGREAALKLKLQAEIRRFSAINPDQQPNAHDILHAERIIRLIVASRADIADRYRAATTAQIPERREANAPVPAAEVSPDLTVEEAAGQRIAEMTLRRIHTPLSILAGHSECHPGERMPFLLSPDFEQRFLQLIEKYVLPKMLKRLRGFVSRATNAASVEDAIAYVDTAFTSKEKRDVERLKQIVDVWKESWQECTTQKPMPLPPRIPQRSALGKVRHFVADQAMRTQYEQASAAIAQTNKFAVWFWSMVTKDIGAYIPPTDDDRELLQSLFTLPPRYLERDIPAVANAFSQVNVEASFRPIMDAAQIDLTLLAAYWRHDDGLFFGQAEAFKIVCSLYGHNRELVAAQIPLSMRYLGDRIFPPKAEVKDQKKK